MCLCTRVYISFSTYARLVAALQVYMLIIYAKLNALSQMKAHIKHTNNLQRALLSLIVFLPLRRKN